MKTKYTRADYLAGACSHRAYYAQFVTPEIKSEVLARFPLKRLCETSDQKNLNSLPLAAWDGLAGGFGTQLQRDALREAGDLPSLGGAVCILKEAAKQLIEEAPAIFHTT